MTEPQLDQEDRDNYETVYGPQPEWHLEDGEPSSIPPDLTHARPGATPRDYESEDDAIYYSLFGK